MIEEYAYLKNTAHNSNELIEMGFSADVVLVCILVYCYKESKS